MGSYVRVRGPVDLSCWRGHHSGGMPDCVEWVLCLAPHLGCGLGVCGVYAAGSPASEQNSKKPWGGADFGHYWGDYFSSVDYL